MEIDEEGNQWFYYNNNYKKGPNITFAKKSSSSSATVLSSLEATTNSGENPSSSSSSTPVLSSLAANTNPIGIPLSSSPSQLSTQAEITTNTQSSSSEINTNLKKESPDLKFLRDLKESCQKNCNSFLNNQLDYLNRIHIFGKTLLQISILLVCLLYYCNIPSQHFNKFLSFINWLLPSSLSSMLYSSTNVLFSRFINLFIDITPQKISVPSGTGYMVLFDFSGKIQEKMNMKSYRNDLFSGKMQIFRKRKFKTWETVMDDVNDGSYMRYFYENTAKKWSDFIFQMYLDGVQPFKGCLQSLVPVMLVNLQIPLEKRFRLENVILLGLICSKDMKADYPYFLQQIVQKLNPRLEKFEIEVNSEKYTCEAYVVNAALDLSEKEKALLLSSGFSFFFLNFFL